MNRGARALSGRNPATCGHWLGRRLFSNLQFYFRTRQVHSKPIHEGDRRISTSIGRESPLRRSLFGNWSYLFGKDVAFLYDTYGMLKCALRMQPCSILDHLVDAVANQRAAPDCGTQPGSYAHHRVPWMNSSINAMMVSGASS